MLVRNLSKKSVILALGIALLGVAGGCGDNSNSTTLPADQVIQKASPAIQAVNSFHFTLETGKVAKAPPGIFITGVDGDVVKPNGLMGDVTATYSGIPVKIKVVVEGKSQYWTDPTSGAWGPMPTELDMASFFDPSKGVSDIIANIKGATSDGTETIDNTNTYRLKGSVPATALKSLSPEVTATGNLTTTLWVGASDFLVRKVSLQGPLLTDEPADLVRTISIKSFNENVKIETPVVK
jgi:lipoprotein LprG